MTARVEFYWLKKTSIWLVNGRDIEAINERCYRMCAKYKAKYYKIIEVWES